MLAFFYWKYTSNKAPVTEMSVWWCYLMLSCLVSTGEIVISLIIPLFS